MFDDNKTVEMSDYERLQHRNAAYCRGCFRILDSVWCKVLPAGTIVDTCDICLAEGLPEDAIYIESEGRDRLAYTRWGTEGVAVWSKPPQGRWFEWWDMDLECFEKEFGIKL